MDLSLLDQLSDRPVTVREFFELMEPPRDGVGFVTPILRYSDSPEAYIGGYVEYEGEIVGIYFNGDTWVSTGCTIEDIDSFMFDEQVNENYLSRVIDVISEEVNDEVVTVDPEIQFDAPPGYQTKLCVFHRPLSARDYEMVTQWPQFGDTEAIYGSPVHGIVGLTTVENVIDNPLDGHVVFSYFHPEYETWRIVDSIQLQMTDPSTANQIHAETGNKLRQHYDEIETICGPPEN